MRTEGEGLSWLPEDGRGCLLGGLGAWFLLTGVPAHSRCESVIVRAQGGCDGVST